MTSNFLHIYTDFILVSCGILIISVLIYFIQKHRLSGRYDESEKKLENQSQKISLLMEKLENSDQKINAMNRELRSAKTNLERLENEDTVTGLANRRFFERVFDEEWRRAKRSKWPISVVLAEIDHFSLYSDGYGSTEGETCLNKIADILKSSASRPGDMVARYADATFAVLLPETSSSGGVTVAEKLRKNVEAQGLQNQYSPKDPFVTISCGVATIIPDEDILPLTFFTRTEHALQKARDEGRNCVKF